MYRAVSACPRSPVLALDFMGTELDRLVIANFYLTKQQQSSALRVPYKDDVEPD